MQNPVKRFFAIGDMLACAYIIGRNSIRLPCVRVCVHACVCVYVCERTCAGACVRAGGAGASVERCVARRRGPGRGVHVHTTYSSSPHTLHNYTPIPPPRWNDPSPAPLLPNFPKNLLTNLR